MSGLVPLILTGTITRTIWWRMRVEERYEQSWYLSIKIISDSSTFSMKSWAILLHVIVCRKDNFIGILEKIRKFTKPSMINDYWLLICKKYLVFYPKVFYSVIYIFYSISKKQITLTQCYIENEACCCIIFIFVLNEFRVSVFDITQNRQLNRFVKGNSSSINRYPRMNVISIPTGNSWFSFKVNNSRDI